MIGGKTRIVSKSKSIVSKYKAQVVGSSFISVLVMLLCYNLYLLYYRKESYSCHSNATR